MSSEEVKTTNELPFLTNPRLQGRRERSHVPLYNYKNISDALSDFFPKTTNTSATFNHYQKEKWFPPLRGLGGHRNEQLLSNIPSPRHLHGTGHPTKYPLKNFDWHFHYVKGNKDSYIPEIFNHLTSPTSDVILALSSVNSQRAKLLGAYWKQLNNALWDAGFRFLNVPSSWQVRM